MFTKEELETKFNPAFDMVLLKIAKAPERTNGGVYIPNQVRDADANETLVGEVIAIGERVVLTINNPLEKGDNVVFTKFTGNKVFSDDTAEYRVVSAKNLQGVFKNG